MSILSEDSLQPLSPRRQPHFQTRSIEDEDVDAQCIITPYANEEGKRFSSHEMLVISMSLINSRSWGKQFDL